MYYFINFLIAKKFYKILFKKPKIAETTTIENVSRPEFVPREVFKFELADAKIPDFHPQYQKPPSRTQKQRQQKTVEPTAAEKTNSQPQDQDDGNTNSDLAEAGSRILQITHPVPTTYNTTPRQRTVKELPFSVQKAISHALKQDYNIPFLDTIKYYFKDPIVKPISSKSNNNNNINGLKPINDNRAKQWWQSPSQLKLTEPTSYTISPQRLPKIVSTTAKPSVSFAPPQFNSNDYTQYPLLRAYPVQYSLNVAADSIDGIRFLYGDRIYSKLPYTNDYGKNVESINSVVSEIQPIDEPKQSQDIDIDSNVHSTPNTLTSTAPILFPDSPNPVRSKDQKQSFVKYYSAAAVDTSEPLNGVSLSNDKNTINLITEAVNAIKQHNPHLDVVPKRIENDELIVHVTPKPEYFITSSPTKDFVTEKNLVYLKQYVDNTKVVNEQVVKKQPLAKIVNHHYLKRIPAPIDNHDNLVDVSHFNFKAKANLQFG